ncbi:MAG: sigma-70 family RNA polymerase sigma factor [Actinobacteria bacterium]|nr:MAG: sigma-70 family RNA polymerase sigma factor [Actinomycetota bacterium]
MVPLPTNLRARRFESVVDVVFEPLQRYFLRRARADEVDDLLSETLLVVWRRLDEVPTQNTLPWCYGVARNVLSNHRRSEGRRLRVVERLEAEPWRGSVGDAGGASDDPALEQALLELGEEDRELVRLWAWEQLEPREIAVVLGATANAVSLKLGRVKQKISSSLERQNREPSGHIPLGNPEQHVGEM